MCCEANPLGLNSRRTNHSTVGSNPTLSAIYALPCFNATHISGLVSKLVKELDCKSRAYIATGGSTPSQPTLRVWCNWITHQSTKLRSRVLSVRKHNRDVREDLWVQIPPLSLSSASIYFGMKQRLSESVAKSSLSNSQPTKNISPGSSVGRASV